MGFGGKQGAERVREERARQGRRGRDWVDDRSWHSGSQSSKRIRSSNSNETRGRKSEDGVALKPRQDLEKW